MKRFHIHVSVDDLAANVRFYSTMFGVPPTILKPDYAKWMVDDPLVNFAISKRGAASGIDHLGVQVDSDTELSMLRERVAAAEIQMLDQPQSDCCYARCDKYWTTDPQAIAWETFHTLDAIPVYGDAGRDKQTNCCAVTPKAESKKSQACCA